MRVSKRQPRSSRRTRSRFWVEQSFFVRFVFFVVAFFGAVAAQTLNVEQAAPGTKPSAALVESFDGLGAGFQGPQGTANFRISRVNSGYWGAGYGYSTQINGGYQYTWHTRTVPCPSPHPLW